MTSIHNLTPGPFSVEKQIVPLDNTNCYTFDNRGQDGIIIGYLTMDFRDVPNKYKCITEIIDRVEIGYHLGNDIINLITMTSYDLLIIHDSVKGPKGDALKKLLNFNARTFVPLMFNHSGYNDNRLFLSTPDDSPIKYTIRVVPKIDIKIELSYDKIAVESHEYIDHFVQEYIEYEEVASLSDGIDKIVIQPCIQLEEYDGVIVDLGSDGNVDDDIVGINEYPSPVYYATSYTNAKMGSRLINTGYQDPMRGIRSIQFNKLLKDVRVLGYKKKKLEFMNGYLVDENGSEIEYKINNDNVLNYLERDAITLSIEL